MKNAYEVRGDVTAIFLRRRSGEIIEALIDTADLDKVKAWPFAWFAKWSDTHRCYYVRSNTARTGAHRTTIALHRYLIDAASNVSIDHRNHNTLDNRRENIRVASHGENMQNKKVYSNNKSSGVRGVDWHEPTQRWRARAQLNGKSYYLGSYDTVDEAAEVVSTWRRDNMPFSEMDRQ